MGWIPKASNYGLLVVSVLRRMFLQMYHAACAGAADFFLGGYWVWARIIQNLADVGYDPNRSVDESVTDLVVQ